MTFESNGISPHSCTYRFKFRSSHLGLVQILELASLLANFQGSMDYLSIPNASMEFSSSQSLDFEPSYPTLNNADRLDLKYSNLLLTFEFGRLSFCKSFLNSLKGRELFVECVK